MKLVQENLWKHPGFPGMIVVTTNGCVRKDGRLVMGRGAALEAAKKIPSIDLEAGKIVRMYPLTVQSHTYNFLVVRQPKGDRLGLGLFQVKHHWSDKADLDLIRKSTEALAQWANVYPDVNIRMNFPGIGNGRLKREEVEPLLYILPDNVTVCCHFAVWYEVEQLEYGGYIVKVYDDKKIVYHNIYSKHNLAIMAGRHIKDEILRSKT